MLRNISRSVFLFLLFCLFNYSYAQTIDSLDLALKNAKYDTARCNILSALSEICEEEDIPKYALPCLKLAETNAARTSDVKLKHFYLKHVAAALNNIGLLAEHQGNTSAAKENYLR